MRCSAGSGEGVTGPWVGETTGSFAAGPAAAAVCSGTS